MGLFLCLLLKGSLQAQADDIHLPAQTASFRILALDHQPEYPGGQEALTLFLLENLRYPLAAREHGIEGKVKVAFTVQADGSITDPRVLEGLGYGCDEEVIRVIKEMPKWKAGILNEATIATSKSMFISFRLYFL
ncbi:MAG: energy transducer TonB [Lewinella sp.]|nr:energy transducer TonB [Lewinella sp.]